MGKLLIKRGEGGLGRRNPSKDMVSGLMFGGVAATGLALDTTSAKLTRVEDAEDLGINQAYDTANNILVYYHIKEFFRMSPSGSLYIRITAQAANTLAKMCDITNAHVRQLLKDAKGDIRQVGVVLNPLTTYTATKTAGIDADVTAAIPKAQALANAEYDLKRPVQVVIEGREFNGTVALAGDLRGSSAPDVHVTILQDMDVAATGDDINEDHAAVGTTLGVISVANVHESIGYVAKFNLADSIAGAFLNPGLSSHKAIADYEGDYENLTAKGYLFARPYNGNTVTNGVYFDDFPACTVITSDYAYGNSRRVINKAVREVYAKLLPRVNSPILLDASTGKIEMAVAKSFEADAEEAMSVMLQADEISGMDAFVDPNQDVQATGKIVTKIAVVEVATGRILEVEIGLTKTI